MLKIVPAPLDIHPLYFHVMAQEKLLAVIIAPVPFLFYLYSLCKVNFVHYILILINVQ